jgi:hypothetical protein
MTVQLTCEAREAVGVGDVVVYEGDFVPTM